MPERAMRAELLLQQTANAYKWTDNLLNDLSYVRWQTLPQVIESNILWQVGHLTVSIYFNSILVIKGHQTTVLQSMPLRLYSQLFTQATPALAIGQVDPEQIHKHLKRMQKHSIETIELMKDNQLHEELLQIEIVHPVAKTKLEALDWNIKHTLWHCGQIALIKRVVDKRHEFRLHER